MEIREASEKDIETVISWLMTKEECQTWAGPNVQFPLEAKQAIKDIEFKSGKSYVCIQSNEVLAFGQILPKGNNISHLARIITNPSFRGKGYGKEICEILVHTALKITATVSLNVYRKNTVAFNLYKSLGFQEVKEKSTETLVNMVKT